MSMTSEVSRDDVPLVQFVDASGTISTGSIIVPYDAVIGARLASDYAPSVIEQIPTSADSSFKNKAATHEAARLQRLGGRLGGSARHAASDLARAVWCD